CTSVLITLYLHDALPISVALPPRHPSTADISCPAAARSLWYRSEVTDHDDSLLLRRSRRCILLRGAGRRRRPLAEGRRRRPAARSEEHTSELQSREKLVC